MELKIERLVHRGLGLARISQRAVFVPAVIPGETVRVELFKQHSSYAYAHLVEVLKPSPYRISPECRYFPKCGGCQLAHISYPHQLQLKREILLESLRRIGKFDPEAKLEDFIPAPSPLRYRSRLRLHLSASGIGFKAFQGRELIKIEDCLLAQDALRASLPALKRLAQELNPKEISSLVLDYDSESGKVFAWIPARKKFFYIYQHGIFSQVSPSRKEFLRLISFTQVHPEQNQKMRKLVASWVESTKAKTALELFAGAGNLSFALAKSLNKLIALELNPFAVELAEILKQEKKIPNLQFLAQSAESYLDYALKRGLNFDLILLDPPRIGAKNEMHKLLSLAPKNIIYLSCEPSTLARDLKILLKADYTLEKIIPLDMFPQTYHIESLSLLQHRP